MKRNCEVRNAHRLHNSQDDKALNHIPGRVLAVWFEGLDVKVGQVPGARA
jgi:hypothetical protein